MSHPHRNASFWLTISFFLFFGTNEVRAQESEFDRWKRQQAQEYQDFQTAEDKAFIKFLRLEWEAFQVYQGNIRDLKPKPPTPPTVRNNIDISAGYTGSAAFTQKRRTTKQSIRLDDFYGFSVAPLTFPVRQLDGLDQPTQAAIADAWSSLSAVDHESILQSIRQYRKQLGLGDWGLIQLLDLLLQPQYASKNARMCYVWYVLTKMGYNVKVGYTSQTLLLLVPPSNKLFGIRYSVIDGQSYYMVPEPTEATVYSYDEHFKPQLSLFDFSLNTLIKPTQKTETRELDYVYKRKPLKLNIHYDMGLSDFLYDYPQIDLPGYFLYSPGPRVSESLRDQIKPALRTLTTRERINYLLGLTQAIFQYETDTDQFGREKYMVVEESLYYGVNDCEDRSIFLAWLIHDLLKLPVVVLDYPGHVALAVRTEFTPEDDTVSFQGRKYLVVDPTYLGASAGMAMPSTLALTPEILPVSYVSVN